MDLGLTGLRAIITGGGSGIGLAIAEQLAAEGCDIAICGRTAETLQAALPRLQRHGRRVLHHQVDVGDGAAIGPWVQAVAAELGGIDVVVHNASGASGVGEEAWARNISIDVLGFSRLVQHCEPYLEASAAASVVGISSTAAIEAFGNPAAPFGAMKAAMIHQCAGLSRTLAPKGIRVNAVSPGPIYFEAGPWGRVRREMPEYYEKIVAEIPRGRMGSPDEVARIVAFVASPAADLITGANIVADGGMTKRIPF